MNGVGEKDAAFTNGENGFRDKARRRLRDDAEKLLELLREPHPDLLIANRVGSLVVSAIACFGPQVLAALAEHSVRLQRRDAGYCVVCEGDPNPCPRNKSMCDTCYDQA